MMLQGGSTGGTIVDDQEWNELYGIKKKDINASDLLYAWLDIILELSKIVVSSLLVVFVPQNCDGSTCNVKENFTELTDLNKGALGWNFITLGIMLILYRVIYRREKFLIYRMDEDAKVPKTNCTKVFMDHPEIENGVRHHNNLLHIVSLIAVLVYIVNIIISCVVIWGYYYENYQSVVQLIINAGLCIYVLWRSIVHSKSSLVLSNTTFSPIVYNEIDKDYLVKKRESFALIGL